MTLVHLVGLSLFHLIIDFMNHVILVVGPSHSGTTISTISIAQHSSIFASGELRNFPYNGQFSSDNMCSCGVSSSKCPFWLSVHHQLQEIPNYNTIDVYDKVFALSNSNYLVDSYHGHDGLEDLIKSINLRQNLRIHLVLLKRNPLLVASSQLKSYISKGRISNTFFPRLKRILVSAVSQKRILSYITSLAEICDLIELDYENLCVSPYEEVSRVLYSVDLESNSVKDIFSSSTVSLKIPPHLNKGNLKLRSMSTIVLHSANHKQILHHLSPLEKLIFRIFHYLPAGFHDKMFKLYSILLDFLPFSS